MAILTRNELEREMKSVRRWRRVRGTIEREFKFKDFVGAVRFVNAVARAAEKACHHPDIDIRWNRVRLVLTTHDEGGLTALDFELARQCDRLGMRK